MAKKVKKQKTRYQKAMLSFFLILLFLSEAAICYVAFALKDFEKNFIDNYMDGLVKNISSSVKHNNADKYFKEIKLTNKYEDKSNLNAGYKELFKNSKVSYKKKETNVYDIYADDTLVATITLDDSDKVTKLGLLNYSRLKVKDVKTYAENGLYEVDANISSDYTLYINKIKVDKEDIKEVVSIDGYAEAPEGTIVPSTNHYVINNLSKKPDVTVTDKNGKDVKVKYENGKYYAISTFVTDDYDEAMSKLTNKINPLEVAEKWSLFLTNDLTGSLHGFYEVSKYLIEGTTVYKNAYTWATGVDITFTSMHTLENPIFKKETMKNFNIYDENSFSVDVHLEKNILVQNGVAKNDILNERMYFTYIDGAYKLVSMKAITE